MHNNSALQCKHDCVCINIILLQLSMSQGCFKDDQAFYRALRILEKYERLKCLKISHNPNAQQFIERMAFVNRVAFYIINI